MQSATESRNLLQSHAICYRVMQSATELSNLLQSRNLLSKGFYQIVMSLYVVINVSFANEDLSPPTVNRNWFQELSILIQNKAKNFMIIKIVNRNKN